MRRLQAILPHQTPDPLLGGADALVAKPGPDLAVALAVERRLGQDAADVPDQFLVRAGAERAAPPGFRPLLDGDGPLMTPEVDGGAGRSQRRQTRARPYFFPVAGEAAWPTSSASSGRKGGRPGSAGAAARCPWSARRPWREPGDLLIPVVGRPALEGGLAGGQEVVPPSGEGGGGDAQLTREQFQVLAAEEAEDGVGLALGGEAAALAGVRGVGHGCGLLGWTR